MSVMMLVKLVIRTRVMVMVKSSGIGDGDGDVDGKCDDDAARKHHQDEELTMQNVRICRTVVSDRHHKRQTMISKIIKKSNNFCIEFGSQF